MLGVTTPFHKAAICQERSSHSAPRLPSGAGFTQGSPAAVEGVDLAMRKLLAATVSLTGLRTLADPQPTAAPTFAGAAGPN